MTDPICSTPEFREAVEVGAKAMCDGAAVRECHSEDVRTALTAALPHLERHFRGKLAEELRAKVLVLRGRPTKSAKAAYYECADHIERGTP